MIVDWRGVCGLSAHLSGRGNACDIGNMRSPAILAVSVLGGVCAADYPARTVGAFGKTTGHFRAIHLPASNFLAVVHTALFPLIYILLIDEKVLRILFLICFNLSKNRLTGFERRFAFFSNVSRQVFCFFRCY